MKTFGDRIVEVCEEKETVVCVGLDPRAEHLPPEILRDHDAGPEEAARAFQAFGEEVLDLVAPMAAAVKPQAAFFEALGPPGFAALFEVCAAARRLGLLVIADVKRGDIGSTAEAYAQAWLKKRGDQPPVADACTVNPYLGSDGIRPFIETAVAEGGGLFVLVRTSNASAGEIQDRMLADGGTVSQHVARLVSGWNRPVGMTGYGPVGAVVGATVPQQLAEFRRVLSASIILVPGYGAQGGTARDVVRGCDARGLGILVNASRSVTIPWGRREDCPAYWQEAVVEAARTMRREINDARARRG
jgi:orotidine-5'-phosphate decarboxylase